MPRIRLCDSDREKYGGPEWVEINMADLLNEETGLIEQIEERWDLTPSEFLNGVGRGSIRCLRAMIWTARHKAGCRDDPRLFRPKTMPHSGITFEPLTEEKKAAAAVDADPPANRATRRARPRTAASKT